MTIHRKTDWIWLWGSGIGGSLLGMVLFGLLGRFIGASNPTGWRDLVGTMLGLLVGSQLGALVGLLLVGRQLSYRRVWVAIPAIIVSASITMVLAEPLHLNATPQLLLGLLAVMPALVATVVIEFT